MGQKRDLWKLPVTDTEGQPTTAWDPMSAPLMKLSLCTLIDSFPQQTLIEEPPWARHNSQELGIQHVTQASTLKEFGVRERPQARGPVKKCSRKTSEGLRCQGTKTVEVNILTYYLRVSALKNFPLLCVATSPTNSLLNNSWFPH